MYKQGIIGYKKGIIRYNLGIKGYKQGIKLRLYTLANTFIFNYIKNIVVVFAVLGTKVKRNFEINNTG